ncbi:hypothetical protein [Paenibacillus physcomitrellae]|uniref:PTS ascorbate transporter subunit IIC n=2 Tax=Paenibacillus physcomitrellae TaxID=1619311 RepID=A0ABQ1FKD3_9BACL|nr:hypothetical protein [Paenibacillus physcomitrellae]GGA19865.1 hypothetical protein GCM10010917_00590 [Paenibacillus physcomitrellae]
MMPDFFKDYNVLFGGGNTSKYLMGLALIAVIAIVVNAVLYGVKSLRAKEADQAAVPSMMM